MCVLIDFTLQQLATTKKVTAWQWWHVQSHFYRWWVQYGAVSYTACVYTCPHVNNESLTIQVAICCKQLCNVHVCDMMIIFMLLVSMSGTHSCLPQSPHGQMIKKRGTPHTWHFVLYTACSVPILASRHSWIDIETETIVGPALAWRVAGFSSCSFSECHMTIFLDQYNTACPVKSISIIFQIAVRGVKVGNFTTLFHKSLHLAQKVSQRLKKLVSLILQGILRLGFQDLGRDWSIIQWEVSW